jgi:hypothetical protein
MRLLMSALLGLLLSANMFATTIGVEEFNGNIALWDRTGTFQSKGFEFVGIGPAFWVPELGGVSLGPGCPSGEIIMTKIVSVQSRIFVKMEHH